MWVSALACAPGLEEPLSSVQGLVTVPMRLPRRAGKGAWQVGGRRPAPPRGPGTRGPPAPPPARPHPAGRPRRRAAGDKVAAQTPRPIAAQPAARSSLALAPPQTRTRVVLGGRDSGARGPGNCLPPLPQDRSGRQGSPARVCVRTSVRACQRVHVSAPLAPSHQPPNRLVPVNCIFPARCGDTPAKSPPCVVCR